MDTGISALGKGLRRLRGERRQKDLARDSGVPQGRFSEYERGAYTPSLKVLDRILRAMGATFLDLAVAMEVESVLPETRDRLVEQFDLLVPEDSPEEGPQWTGRHLESLMEDRLDEIRRSLAMSLRETARDLEFDRDPREARGGRVRKRRS
ncbi:MAG: helix-turn-helix transcriptional regulator [Acidobacteriota bacterium]